MREDVVAAARARLGTRWRHQGRLNGVGLDCIGLVGDVALECGVPEAAGWANDKALHAYGRTPDPEVLIAACDKYLAWVLGPIELGDIVVMKHEPETQPRHFAIVSRLDPMYVIHAYAQAKKVVENRVDEKWRSRILRVYRFR